MKRLLIAAAALAASAGPVLAAEGALFISPSGKPYTAEAGKPYPIADWFKAADKNADGKIDPAEMRADADAFFTELDRNKDNVIGSQEVRIYEIYYVPEILSVGELDNLPLNQRPGFARAQGVDARADSIAPSGGGESNLKPRQRLNTNQGAVQFSLFREPEPVRAADRNLDYLVTRPEFAAQADRHFKALDINADGFVTLDELPQTPAERAAGGKKRR